MPETESGGPSPWERVIARGKEEGYVTMQRIRGVFDELHQVPPASLEPVVRLLRDMGIEVVEGEVAGRGTWAPPTNV